MRKLNQKGFILEAFATLFVIALIVGFVMALFTINIKLSSETVSGIVYNTHYDRAISGNANFCIRAGIDTYVNDSNESCYCLPQKSPYIALVKRAAEDKRIKVVTTANKYGFRLAAPWTCINNVTVTEIK